MSLSNISEIGQYIELREEEKQWKAEGNYLPVLLSDEVVKLLDHEEIRRQFVPSVKEKCDEIGTLDPLEEVRNSSYTPRLIHRYENRAALLMTDRCFAYCRHCFRRRFTGTETGPIGNEDLEKAIGYLKEHEEIREVLLTGGDMFTLSDERIDYILSRLKEERPDIIYRLCTRALFSNPERFTDNLFSIIERHDTGAPFMLMTQFNHPLEISDKARSIVLRFLKMGIPSFNQAVLLRGVNDDVDTLVELSYALLKARIKPYYLFQGDLVNGTAHLRVPLSKGIELERELRRKVSGLAMPEYTMDLPEGGGKVIVTENHIKGREGDVWTVESPYGGSRHYPEDK